MSALSPLCGLLLALVAAPAGTNLLANSGFEEGWVAWNTNNPWYEAGGEGKGNGLSTWTLDEQVFHSGKASARVQGQGNRGLAMQILAGYADRYRLSGWVRTEGLDAGTAYLLAEFKANDGTYLGGQAVAGVTGTTDWTYLSGEVTAPPGTRMICIDLLTSNPNNGVAWFDDISLEDVTRDTEPPAPVSFKPAPANAGCLALRWDRKRAEEDVVRYEVFVSEQPFRTTTGMFPRASFDAETEMAEVAGLKDGRSYYVWVAAVDRDGNRLQEAAPRKMTVKDNLAPRPVAVEAFPVLSRNGALLVRWRPHRLDFDLAGFNVVVGSRQQSVPASRRELLVDGVGTRPLTVSVAAKDTAGNLGPKATLRVALAPAAAGRTAGLSGVVRAGGKPVAGATVTAVTPDGRRRQTTSRADGRYFLRLPTLASGSAALTPSSLTRVRASAPGYLDSLDTLLLLRAGDRLTADLALAVSTAELSAWSTPSLANVFPDAETPASPSLGIDWLAVRGETEGSQVVLRSARAFTITGVALDPLAPVGAASGGAKQPSPPAALRPTLRAAVVGTFFADKNSTATPPELLLRQAPAEFPDPFLEGFPQAVPANTARPVYLMVDVPRNAAPGRYRGTARVQVNLKGIGPAQISVPLSLEVAPVTLPARPTLPVTHWFNIGNLCSWHKVPLWSERFWEILRAYARDMAAHRQTVTMVPLDTIDIYCDLEGKFVFDFSRFDRWVELFTSEGVGQRLEIMHFGGREHGQWEDKNFVLYPRSAIDRRTGLRVPVAPPTEVAAAIEQHLIEKGWLERAVLHIADEPITLNVASWREISRKIREGASRVKRIDAIHVAPSEVRGALEVMVPQLNYFSDFHSQFMEAKQQGAEVWFYIAWVPQGKFPNRLIDYPAIKTRIIPWMVHALDASGYLHWGLNFWTPELKDVGFAPGDNWIVYPGSDGPRSSLRWEAFRDGLEDYELFQMLAARRPEEARQLMAAAVRNATDYETDPARLEAVRRRVVQALAQQ
ncbi:MAG: DUF4091 domain-containing protein [Armatimonadetes bacterium]|nr:DUF4091 domain-containing protein [Armatimonadota bacterium]